MATGKQLLASLAMRAARGTGIGLALPRSVTTRACLSLYTFGRPSLISYQLGPVRKLRPARSSGRAKELASVTATRDGLGTATRAESARSSHRVDLRQLIDGATNDVSGQVS